MKLLHFMQECTALRGRYTQQLNHTNSSFSHRPIWTSTHIDGRRPTRPSHRCSIPHPSHPALPQSRMHSKPFSSCDYCPDAVLIAHQGHCRLQSALQVLVYDLLATHLCIECSLLYAMPSQSQCMPDVRLISASLCVINALRRTCIIATPACWWHAGMRPHLPPAAWDASVTSIS